MPTYDTDAPMTTMDWVVTQILLIIPVVNIICFIVWLFGVGNINRVTYIRASVVFVLLAVALAFGAVALGFSLEQLDLT